MRVARLPDCLTGLAAVQAELSEAESSAALAGQSTDDLDTEVIWEQRSVPNPEARLAIRCRVIQMPGRPSIVLNHADIPASP
jgi:hypothetical protein